VKENCKSFYHEVRMGKPNEIRKSKKGYLQARNDDIEHCSESIATIGDILVNNYAIEPNKKSP